jgi:hypothetical protein
VRHLSDLQISLEVGFIRINFLFDLICSYLMRSGGSSKRVQIFVYCTLLPPYYALMLSSSNYPDFSISVTRFEPVRTHSPFWGPVWTLNWTLGPVLAHWRTLDRTSVRFLKVRVRTSVQDRTTAWLILLSNSEITLSVRWILFTIYWLNPSIWLWGMSTIHVTI